MFYRVDSWSGKMQKDYQNPAISLRNFNMNFFLCTTVFFSTIMEPKQNLILKCQFRDTQDIMDNSKSQNFMNKLGKTIVTRKLFIWHKKTFSTLLKVQTYETVLSLILVTHIWLEEISLTEKKLQNQNFQVKKLYSSLSRSL